MGRVSRGGPYASAVRALYLILSLLAPGAAARAAPPEQTPRQVIAQLGLDTRANASRDWTRQHEAETAAALQLRRLIQAKPGDPSLTETDGYGRTPLMEAAVNGYADVVEALLTDPGVQAHVNDSDRFGATAWGLSQFARPVTLIACHPQMYARDRVPLLKPYAQRAAYFRNGSTTSFARIAGLLVGAGARADAAAAKAAWLTQCPGADEALRQRLQASEDLSQALWAYTFERLEQFKREMADTPARLPPAPLPGPVLAGAETRNAWQQRWPKAWVPRSDRPAPADPSAGVQCTRMGKPEMPAVNWTGEATFRLVIELQAGAPTVIDIGLVSGRMEPRMEALLQAVLLRTLASYECAGDHIFEQEFQFKVQ